VDKLVDGWNLSGVTTIQDGTPLTITDSRLGTVFGAGVTPLLSNAEYAPGMGPANVGTSGSLTQRVATSYLNAAAFTATNPASAVCAGCTGTLFGNSGLGTILGPGQNNWDMSLSKLTTVGGIREDATLQFRAEFFNTFNHPQFSNPNNSTTGQVGANLGTSFGQITSLSVNQRLIQLALKYTF
jgi:hypothetical protein